jgi:hypothetical protein
MSREAERPRDPERERWPERERTSDAVSGGLEADPSMAGVGSSIEGTQELEPARPGSETRNPILRWWSPV